MDLIGCKFVYIRGWDLDSTAIPYGYLFDLVMRQLPLW